MTDTPEWHRSENQWSILLYTLKEERSRRGEPVMVNDLMIRIENAHGSNHDLGPIADKLLTALNSTSAEPVAWRYDDLKIDNFDRPVFFTKRRSGVYLDTEEFSEIPLYAHPAPVTVEAATQVLLKWCDDRQSEVVNCLDLRADEEASAVLWIENFRNAIRALSGEKS